MTRRSLFRKEALQHTQYKHLGTVFLNVPLSYQRFVILWCAVVLVLVCITGHQKYAEKWAMKGFINAEGGLTHTYALKSGVIQASYAYAGKPVTQGDILFVINTSDGQGSALQAKRIHESFEKRLRAMRQQLIHKVKFLKQLKPLLLKQYIAREFFDQKREEIVALKNQIHQLEREETEFRRAKKAYIKASISGVISSVMAHVGQHVSTEKPLLSILPKDAAYVAELYVPADKAGFLKVSDKLSLHYDAYPYQRFGAAWATVISVSQSVLTDKDEDKALEIKQPYYKAVARLNTPFIQVSGSSLALQQGMTFTAIATGVSQKVWRWIVMPFYLMWRE